LFDGVAGLGFLAYEIHVKVAVSTAHLPSLNETVYSEPWA